MVTVTLNRPERRNAISSAMWGELLSTFREIAASTTDRCVVVTGAGGAFCSGADLAGGEARGEGRGDGQGEGRGEGRHQLSAMRYVNSVAVALHELPQPTIAKVGGIAAGAGLNLALGCDLIVAGEDARFSEIFARRGLTVDFGGTWLLPRLIGLHKAKELAFFADILSAREAADLGLVNRVVPMSELDAAVDQWARRLASSAPIALAQTKQMLNRSLEATFSEALEHEGWAQTVSVATEDAREAIGAFLAKRDPHFRGR